MMECLRALNQMLGIDFGEDKGFECRFYRECIFFIVAVVDIKMEYALAHFSRIVSSFVVSIFDLSLWLL